MAERHKSSLPINIYYSYAPEDRIFFQRLEKHLRLLQQQGIINGWQSEQVLPGDEKVQQELEHLRTATLILLLVSIDFINSEVCYGRELPLALQLYREGQARVVPILLRAFDWQLAPFAKLPCLPTNREPIELWSNQDTAFTEVAQSIRAILIELGSPIDILAQELIWMTKSSELLIAKQTDRSRFLRRVHDIWIAGVLEHSLGHEVFLNLALDIFPSALSQPWPELVFPDQVLPTQSDILQTYEDACGDLLILGDPGAGKTTLLLQLADVLLKRAEKYEEQPMPAVFLLASWAVKRQSLSVWLVEELYDRYQVPRKLGKYWLENNLLLPLLDGLDEVVEDYRADCIVAINQLRQEYYNTPLYYVLGKNEYFAQSERVRLQRAVFVQPLNDSQIYTYLSNKKHLLPLYNLLQKDESFRRLISSPLLLNISKIIYEKDNSVMIDLEHLKKTHYHQLLKLYTEQVINKRAMKQRYTPEQVRKQLSTLAWQTKHHQQIVFYIERLNITWLGQTSFRKIYIFGTVLLCTLLGMLIGAPIGGLVGWMTNPPNFLKTLIIGGVGFGIVGCVMSATNLRMPLPDSFVWSFKVIKQQLFIIIICTFVGAFVGSAGSYHPVISAISGSVFGCLIGVLIGVLTGGFVEITPDIKKIEKPNQAIRKSVCYSLLIVVICMLFAVLFAIMWSPLALALVGGFGLLGTLGLGGLASIEHFLLRLLLKVSGQMPWDVVGFLDAAVDCGLMRKVGSGYMFMHALLLDYFAGLEEADRQEGDADG